MATDVSWREHTIPATSHLKSVAANRAKRQAAGGADKRITESRVRAAVQQHTAGQHLATDSSLLHHLGASTTPANYRAVREHIASLRQQGHVKSRVSGHETVHSAVVQQHASLAHDGKQAAHPHAMMHGPKGGSFYYGAGGKKIYHK